MQEQSAIDNTDQPEESDKIIFDAEKENLSEGQWFEKNPGNYEITFLDNGKKEPRTYDDEEKTIGVFNISIDGQELKWSVPVGETEASCWGQLMKLGAHHQGLEGQTIHLTITGQGKKKRYTIQEAADL